MASKVGEKSGGKLLFGSVEFGRDNSYWQYVRDFSKCGNSSLVPEWQIFGVQTLVPSHDAFLWQALLVSVSAP